MEKDSGDELDNFVADLQTKGFPGRYLVGLGDDKAPMPGIDMTALRTGSAPSSSKTKSEAGANS